MRPEDYFTAAEIARSAAYNGPRYAIALGAIAVELIVLAVLGLGPGARRLGAWSARIAGDRWIRRAALLVAVVTIVPLLVRLPLVLARHRHDVRFGLATNTVLELLRDVGVGALFALATSLIAAVGTIALARRFRRAWPLVLWVAGGAFIAGMVFVWPLVYEPAFNTFRPVDAQTDAMVRALAVEAGVPVRSVVVADASRRTSKRNAYVSGIGASRRVVLYDTLLQESTTSDVRLVVAHELAHVAHHDVRNGTLMGIGGFGLGIAVLWLLMRSTRVRAIAGADHPSDPALVPFLAVFIAAATLVSLPANNAISRSIEARADTTAIALTDDPQAAVRLEVNLARDNVADLDPNAFIRWLLFTHPPTMERIEAAQQ